MFGVKDKPRQIMGSQFRNTAASLQSLKQEVARELSPHLTFIEIFELIRPEGRVLLFQIPPAPVGMPVSWKGLLYGRNGESLAGLSIEKIERIRRQAMRDDWSAELVPDAGMADLDADALSLGVKSNFCCKFAPIQAMSYTEDSLVEQPANQCFPFCAGKSSMFSHQNGLHYVYAIT